MLQTKSYSVLLEHILEELKLEKNETKKNGEFFNENHFH